MSDKKDGVSLKRVNAQKCSVQMGKAVRSARYLKLGKDILNEELEKRTLADNKSIAEKDLAELKKNADADQLTHKNKINTIRTKQNAGIKKLFEQTKFQIEKSNKDFSKRINDQNKKLESVTGLSNKLEKLESRSETLKTCASRFGNGLDLMNSKVNSMRNELKADHIKDFNHISEKENQTIDKMLATGSRLFGNSEYYENMITALNEYKKTQENPEGMTREAYQTAVRNARESINTYIQNRNDNGGKRKTDVGQIRLDSAKNLLKMFDMKERSLENYQSELQNINSTPQKEITIKTEAEKVVLNRLDKMPPHKEELLTNRQLNSLVGNKQVKDMFNKLQKGSENINKTISDKLSSSIDSLSKGNASALKSVIASKVGLNLLEKQGRNLSREEALRLVENLQDKPCIKECAEDILKGRMKPSDLDEYLKSDDFNSDLKNQASKKQDAPEKQNSAENNSLGIN